MREVRRKVGARLPLFPLNTVLFPGMSIQLHIFEDRYKEMMQECIENQSPFGVVLIKEGQEALGPLAAPHPIGCSAILNSVQALSEGRLNIQAVGLEKFRILELDHEGAYLVGEVEDIPLDQAAFLNLEQETRRLLPRIEQYLNLLGDENTAAGILPHIKNFPPMKLAYLACELLQILPHRKQRFLEIESPETLVYELRKILRSESRILRYLREQKDANNSGDSPISLN